MTDFEENRQGVAGGGTKVSSRDTTHGSAEGFSKGKVHVDIDLERKTYLIRLDLGVIPAGKADSVHCVRDKCNPETSPFYIAPNFQGLIENRTLDDPNHVHGSKTTVSHTGRGANGSLTETLTWDLAREGVKQ
jgi:hypothetical protein